MPFYKWYSAITSHFYYCIEKILYLHPSTPYSKSIHLCLGINRKMPPSVYHQFLHWARIIHTKYFWLVQVQSQTNRSSISTCIQLKEDRLCVCTVCFPCRFIHFIKLLWPLCDWRYEICIWFGWRLPQVYSRQAFQTWHIGKPFLENIFDQSGRWQRARNVLCSLTLT